MIINLVGVMLFSGQSYKKMAFAPKIYILLEDILKCKRFLLRIMAKNKISKMTENSFSKLPLVI
jgi:hypothetical protein